MHQHKTVAQILLMLFIFNLVLAAPVVREIHDARGDVARPVVVGNAITMSKERRQSSDAGPTSLHSSPSSPDGSIPSHPSPQYSDGETPPDPHPPPQTDGSIPSVSSSQFPDGPYSPPPLSDGLTSSHSSPLMPGWLLHTPSASDEVESLPELPTSPGVPASLAISPPPSEIVPATGLPAPATQTTRIRHVSDEERELSKRFMKRVAASVAMLGTGGLVAYYRHRDHVHRTIVPEVPERYVSNISHLSTGSRRLNVPNHKRLAYGIFLSSMAKGSGHPCLGD